MGQGGDGILCHHDHQMTFKFAFFEADVDFYLQCIAPRQLVGAYQLLWRDVDGHDRWRGKAEVGAQLFGDAVKAGAHQDVADIEQHLFFGLLVQALIVAHEFRKVATALGGKEGDGLAAQVIVKRLSDRGDDLGVAYQIADSVGGFTHFYEADARHGEPHEGIEYPRERIAGLPHRDVHDFLQRVGLVSAERCRRHITPCSSSKRWISSVLMGFLRNAMAPSSLTRSWALGGTSAVMTMTKASSPSLLSFSRTSYPSISGMVRSRNITCALPWR